LNPLFIRERKGYLEEAAESTRTMEIQETRRDDALHQALIFKLLGQKGRAVIFIGQVGEVGDCGAGKKKVSTK
jgi:hypothetical protein